MGKEPSAAEKGNTAAFSAARRVRTSQDYVSTWYPVARNSLWKRILSYTARRRGQKGKAMVRAPFFER